MLETKDNCLDMLTIQTVSLKKLLIETDEEKDIEDIKGKHLENTQDLKYIKAMRELEVKDDKGDVSYLYRFYVNLGIRSFGEQELIFREDVEHTIPIFEIKAQFVAQYSSPCKLEPDDLQGFAAKYSYYHIWPYWREVIQSSCARLGLSPIVIEPYRIN